GVLTGSHMRLGHRWRSLCHFCEGVAVLPVVRRLGTDHLHAHWAVGSATCAMVVSRFLDIPFSFTAHAYDIWRERLLLPEKIRVARAVVTCTDYNRRHLIEAYDADPARIRTVHHGLSIEHFRPPDARIGSEAVIVSVGRLVEQKGFSRLIRACGQLAREGLAF